MKKQRVFGRLLRYIFGHYRWRVLVVAVCIAVSAIAPLAGIVFTRQIVDICIVPGLKSGLDSVWRDLVGMAMKMGIIFVLGVIATGVYTQLMARIGQGTDRAEYSAAIVRSVTGVYINVK